MEGTELIRVPFGKDPVNLGDYDELVAGGQTSFGIKNRVNRYGCEWESLVDNNTDAPAVWDGGDTITPSENWKLNAVNPDAWLMSLDKPASTGTTGDYPYNGLGRIVLKKKYSENSDYANQPILEQADFDDANNNHLTNTVFVIKYDFVLTEDITLGSGCVLEFDGGSISGAYTLTGTNTGIKAGLVKIFNTNVTLAGSWNVTEAYPEWFGAVGDGVTDDSNAIGKAVNISSIVIFDGRKEYMFGYIHVTSNTIMYCNNAKFIHAPNNVNQPDFIWVTNAKLIIKDAIIDGNPSFYVNKQKQYYLLHASTKGSLEVYNCHFKNVYGHVCSLGTTWIGTNISDYAWDCKIINCKFDLYTDFEVGGDAINSAKCNGITIEGNTINGGFSGIRLQLYCKNIKVCNNIVKNINRDVAITIAHSEDSIVDNNICCGCYSNGIEIRGVVTSKVTNNKVYDNGGSGIALAQYTIGVTSDSNYFGTVSEKYPNVPGNTQDGSGIEMPCLETNIDNNLFYNNGKASYFYKSVVTISNNVFKEPVNENNCQVVVTNNTTPYSRLYFGNNIFYCNETDLCAISFYNNENSAVTFGKGNKVFNCRKLGIDLIIGENIEIDLFDKLSLYDPDSIDSIKVSSNGVVAMFDNLLPSAKVYHVIVKAASSAGNITFVINRYKADGTFVATKLESTKNIGTDFNEINLYFTDTTKDYTDRYAIQFNGAESTPIIVKECCIYSTIDNKATLVP